MLPQKRWREMSGRQAKVINELVITYGIPFNGATVNLPEVVRALRDFLARNARRFRYGDDEMLRGRPATARRWSATGKNAFSLRD